MQEGIEPHSLQRRDGPRQVVGEAPHVTLFPS